MNQHIAIVLHKDDIEIALRTPVLLKQNLKTSVDVKEIINFIYEFLANDYENNIQYVSIGFNTDYNHFENIPKIIKALMKFPLMAEKEIRISFLATDEPLL